MQPLQVTLSVLFLLASQSHATTSATRQLALEIGFTPENMAVANLASAVETLLQRVTEDTELRANVEACRSNEQQLHNQAAAVTSAFALAVDDASLQAQHADLANQVIAARALTVQAVIALRAYALECLNEAARTDFLQCVENDRCSIPPEFRVLYRTDAQWAQIEEALRAERRATQLGTALPLELSALLNTIRTDLNVIAAKQRLIVDLPSIALYFEAFIE